MKSKQLILTLSLLLTSVAWGQNLKLSFMSQNGARFFVYLNGKLQNERPVGHLTLQNLEDKAYTVRIEIDDPYQMFCTKKIRPSEVNYEYTVNFNAVRERIYLKREKSKDRAKVKDQPHRKP